MRKRVGKFSIEEGTRLVVSQNQLMGEPTYLRTRRNVKGKTVLGQQGAGKSALVIADRSVAGNGFCSDLHAANHLAVPADRGPVKFVQPQFLDDFLVPAHS